LSKRIYVNANKNIAAIKSVGRPQCKLSHRQVADDPADLKGERSPNKLIANRQTIA
jgi:hypothetical protein